MEAKAERLSHEPKGRLVWSSEPNDANQSEFRVEDVLSAFVHEARNALFGISATLEAFEADFGDSELGSEYASMMRQPLHKLSVLMEELVDYARPLALEKQQVEVAAIASEAAAASTSLAQRRGVSLKLVVAHAESPPVRLDADRLRAALTTLIDSAIMRSARGDEVEVHVDDLETDGDRLVRFSVRDHGSSLEPGARFEPAFAQKAHGTVFNLARAQRVAREHGGNIVAQNHPHAGVVVSVLLPITTYTERRLKVAAPSTEGPKK